MKKALTFEDYEKMSFKERHDLLYGSDELHMDFCELVEDVLGLPELINGILRLSPNAELYECCPETWYALRSLERFSRSVTKDLESMHNKLSNDNRDRANKIFEIFNGLHRKEQGENEND